MKLQFLLIPFSGDFHLIIRLIANAMIDEIQANDRKSGQQTVLVDGWSVARQEKSLVTVSFDKCVGCVTVLGGVENGSISLKRVRMQK